MLIFSKKKTFVHCSGCKKDYSITIRRIEKTTVEVGYHGEKDETYFLKCPRCYKKEVVNVSELPFRLRLKVQRKK